METAPQSLTDRVIASFGNLSDFAKALGHNSVSTVHGWKHKQRIPNWRRHEIIEAAKRLDKSLPEDFTRESDAA